MPEMDSLASAKAAALASLEFTPNSSNRSRARRRRRKARNSKPQVKDVSNSIPTSNAHLETSTSQNTRPSTETQDASIEDVPIPEELQTEFAQVLKRFGGDTPNANSHLEEQLKGPETETIVEDENKVNKESSQMGSIGDKDDGESLASCDFSADGEDKGNQSRKQLKERRRNLITKLKSLASSPEIVESWDVSASDPVFLVHLKSVSNSVAVPSNWRHKRKYLQGKRGMEKRAFKLPGFIADTGVGELRDAQLEADVKKSLRQKQREKMRAKTGKGVEVDVGCLYDAFFKFQTKPRLTGHGDLYYELREIEVDSRGFIPGVLSDELKNVLGIRDGLTPMPWLVNMQRYGPPPGYPGLKIAGVNCAIPKGAQFGFQSGGWGKVPVDAEGRPIYGDVFEEGRKYEGRDLMYELNERGKEWLWGEIENEVEDGRVTVSEMRHEEDGDEEEKENADSGEGAKIQKGGGEVGGGEVVVGGEIRKGVPEGQLYGVLERRDVSVGRGEFMGSTHAYNIPGVGVEGNVQEGGNDANGMLPAGEKRKRKEEEGEGRDGRRGQKKRKEFKF